MTRHCLLLTCLIPFCVAAPPQTDHTAENFANGLINAVFGALFPDLQQNSAPNLRAQNSPSQPQAFLNQPQEVLLQQPQGKSAVFADPQSLAPSTTKLSNGWASNTGGNLVGNQLPPVDFARGSPPNFNGLTNPDLQNSILFPSGLQGRTDLPANFVYPFAAPGSLVRPASNGDLFQLGQNRQLQQQQPVNSAPQLQQQGVFASPPQQQFDPRAFNVNPGQPPVSVFPSFSPLVTSLLNPPINGQLPAAAIAPSAAQASPPFVPQGFSLFKSQPTSGSSSKSSNSSKTIFNEPDTVPTAEIQKEYRRIVAKPQTAAVTRTDEVDLSAFYPQGSSAQQRLPLFDSRRQPAVLGTFGSQSFQPSDLNQPVLLQPQIVNQIFPPQQQQQLQQQQLFQQQQQFLPQQQQFAFAQAQGPEFARLTVAPGGAASPRKNAAQLLREPEVYGVECPQCVPIDLSKMAGPWVQIYGNPDSLRTIYSTISTLQGLYGDGSVEGSAQSVTPSCIGFQISRPHALYDKSLKTGLESTLNLYYRDDSSNRQLHEVLGRIRQDPTNRKLLSIKLPGFAVPMCAVKAGPSSSTMYGYTILTETIGASRCQSYHVLARDSDTFFRDHNRNVAEFLKTEVETGRAKPLSVLPFPDLCQLQSISQILKLK